MHVFWKVYRKQVTINRFKAEYNAEIQFGLMTLESPRSFGNRKRGVFSQVKHPHFRCKKETVFWDFF